MLGRAFDYLLRYRQGSERISTKFGDYRREFLILVKYLVDSRFYIHLQLSSLCRWFFLGHARACL